MTDLRFSFDFGQYRPRNQFSATVLAEIETEAEDSVSPENPVWVGHYFK